MAVTLESNLPLADQKAMLQHYFSSIPVNNGGLCEKSSETKPSKARTGVQVNLKAMGSPSLWIAFRVKSLTAHHKSGVEQYLKHVLASRGPKTLTSYEITNTLRSLFILSEN
eukprot:GHVN01019337.1.p1 GENE.GHVN01019337.1~~GHVN01019337.1.p1  ORF type:complete len:112 (+),score=7.02 GHVN01019337.1:1063-1398(+)